MMKEKTYINLYQRLSNCQTGLKDEVVLSQNVSPFDKEVSIYSSPFFLVKWLTGVVGFTNTRVLEINRTTV